MSNKLLASWLHITEFIHRGKKHICFPIWIGFLGCVCLQFKRSFHKGINFTNANSFRLRNNRRNTSKFYAWQKLHSQRLASRHPRRIFRLTNLFFNNQINNKQKQRHSVNRLYKARQRLGGGKSHHLLRNFSKSG